MTDKKYIKIMIVINNYLCINSKSFHGLQISNLNIKELLIHFIIVYTKKRKNAYNIQ